MTRVNGNVLKQYNTDEAHMNKACHAQASTHNCSVTECQNNKTLHKNDVSAVHRSCRFNQCNEYTQNRIILRIFSTSKSNFSSYSYILMTKAVPHRSVKQITTVMTTIGWCMNELLMAKTGDICCYAHMWRAILLTNTHKCKHNECHETFCEYQMSINAWF